MTPVTTAIEFFSVAELRCKGSGRVILDPRFAEALPELRRAWGGPLSVTSVCRTPAHNKAVGGHPHSLHLTENPKHPTFGTMAADIRWREWPTPDKMKFAKLAWSLGWSVGLHDGFCHVDRRIEFMRQACFLYGTWSGSFGPAEVVDQ